MKEQIRKIPLRVEKVDTLELGVGALLVIVSFLMPIVFNMDNDPTFFDVMGRYLAILAAAVMLMFKSLSLTKEFVGVN